jgi:hypothetical protein
MVDGSWSIPSRIIRSFLKFNGIYLGEADREFAILKGSSLDGNIVITEVASIHSRGGILWRLFLCLLVPCFPLLNDASIVSKVSCCCD